MASRQEVQITISPNGEVKTHIMGMKGKKCLKLVEALQRELGPVKDQRLTSEYYEPDVEIEIKSDRQSH